MKSTPHVVVATILVLVALIGSAGAIIGTAGGFALPTRELRIVGPASLPTVIPGENALQPLVVDLDGPMANPFSPRKAAASAMAKIPLPPPPLLDFPALPPLPLPEK
jgi:hypothetical protein